MLFSFYFGCNILFVLSCFVKNQTDIESSGCLKAKIDWAIHHVLNSPIQNMLNTQILHGAKYQQVPLLNSTCKH